MIIHRLKKMFFNTSWGQRLLPAYSLDELAGFFDKDQLFIKGLNSWAPDKNREMLDINDKIFYYRMDCLSPILSLMLLYDRHGTKGIERFLKASRCNDLHRLNGVYPLDLEVLSRFCMEYITALKLCNYIGCWKKDFVPEQYLVQRFCLNKQFYLGSKINGINTAGHYGGLVWFDRVNWYDKLRNKKILIISLHSEAMKKQWLNNHVFKAHSRTLTQQSANIQLEFLKPPMSGGWLTPHQSWMESLSVLKEEVGEAHSRFNFDLALVSCGGYGAPICSYISESLNKSVFYVGGALQLYFCIKGNRWSQNKIYNQYWASVSPDKIPINHHQVERGAYW